MPNFKSRIAALERQHQRHQELNAEIFSLLTELSQLEGGPQVIERIMKETDPTQKREEAWRI